MNNETTIRLHLQKMPLKLIECLSRNNAILAGGALRAVFAREAVSDYDMYFENRTCADECADQLTVLYPDVVPFKTANAVTFKIIDNNKTIRLQIILVVTGTPENVIDTFDFTVCQAAYGIKTGKLYTSERFFPDLAARALVVNGKLRFPLNSTVRAFKYQRKGYDVSAATATLLAMQCQMIKIETVADWKAQLMGLDALYVSAIIAALEKDYKDEEVISKDRVYEILTRTMETMNDEIS